MDQRSSGHGNNLPDRAQELRRDHKLPSRGEWRQGFENSSISRYSSVLGSTVRHKIQPAILVAEMSFVAQSWAGREHQ